MALPQPEVALTDICSAVFNNTLYTYSSSAFQSLSLTRGAKWKQLPSGESVTGATCVGSTPADSSQAGFFVVGGNGPEDYKGLQKFTYSTGNWTTITPMTTVTQNRLYHAATYLNDSDTIFMYAGSQDGSSGPSTQTFTIQASEPYAVISYSSTAPPAVSPILLQWSSSTAVMIGGDTSNTRVMLFDPSTGWTDSNASLSTPLTKNTGSIQASLATGDDGSKNLFTYDMSLSPNSVSRIVLVDSAGKPVASAAPVKRDDSSLTATNWPAYNSTLAPTTTRSGFSAAQGADDMVVIAGGGGSDVLCVFDERENSWRNATQMLTSQKVRLQTVSSSSPSSSATPTSTSSPTISATAATTTSAAASTTAAAATATSHGLSTNIILAIVLSLVAGLGLFLVILYFLILRHKRRNYLETAQNRRASGAPSSEKDAFAVANDFSQHGSGKGTFRGYHQAHDSTNSLSSVGILMGRVNQGTPQSSTRDMSSNPAANSFSKGLKGTISKPILQTSAEQNLGAAAIPRQAQFERVGASTFGASVVVPRTQRESQSQSQQQQDNTRRSSGWNRYWSGGSTLNIIGFGNGNGNGNAHASNANNQATTQRTTVVSDVSSTYSSADQHRITQDSATVPPLNIPSMPDSKPRFQRVNSGSPTISSYDNYIKDGMQGKIERQASRESIHSAYSSGVPASVHEPWDPTASDKPWGSSRAPSSAYSSGGYYNTPLAPATNSNNKRAYVPTGMSRQPQLAMANTSSDMSWLNLGDAGRL